MMMLMMILMLGIRNTKERGKVRWMLGYVLIEGEAEVEVEEGGRVVIAESTVIVKSIPKEEEVGKEVEV